jgi:hypothetical protein
MSGKVDRVDTTTTHTYLKIMSVNLNNEQDRFVWGLTTNGKFTVKSLYEDLMSDHTPYLRKYL